MIETFNNLKHTFIETNFFYYKMLHNKLYSLIKICGQNGYLGLRSARATELGVFIKSQFLS